MPSETEIAARREAREAARQLAHERGATSMARLPHEGLSTSSILDATLRKIRQLAPHATGNYLDVGSGNGELIDRVMRQFQVKPYACDYRDDLLTLGDLQVEVVDLNAGELPYQSNFFELVTCTEVIEHLEDHRAVLREILRVLRPGGLLILTTPNVLNLRSRLRYLFFGFFNMFGPLRMDDDRRHSTHGHINPVSYFYLAQALHTSGFREINVSIDKRQRRSLVSLALLWLPLRLVSFFSKRRERHKYHTLDDQNERFVEAMNSSDLLLGRTIVVGCRKPST